jgi:hypothetical protein
LVVALGTFLAFSTRGAAPALSADDLLKESEAALDTLLGSGRGLYRVWDGEYQIRDTDGRVMKWNCTIHEWLEGVHQARLARRVFDDRGRLIWVMVADRDSAGQSRSRTYYTTQNPVGPRGVVTVDANAGEYRQALSVFESDDRRALEQFFLRTYGPGVAGERAYNRAILGTAGGGASEPVLTLTKASIDGVDAHRVEIFEPRRIWFTRTTEGALTASLVRYSQTRLIAPRTGLAVKVVTDTVDESGRWTMLSWTARSDEMRRLGSQDDSAFDFEAPGDVPVRRAQALEDLMRMLPAFRALQIQRTVDVR